MSELGVVLYPNHMETSPKPLTVALSLGGDPIKVYWRDELHGVKRVIAKWRQMAGHKLLQETRNFFLLELNNGLKIEIYRVAETGQWYFQRQLEG